VASFQAVAHALDFSQSLDREGYEVYILPNYDSQGDKIFRIAVGSFINRQTAKAFASSLMRKGLSDNAKVILLDTK
jgi:cell division septation protein DedD